MKREADGTFNGPDCWLLLLPSQSAGRYGSLSKLGLGRLLLLFILTWSSMEACQVPFIGQ